jgi:hypothetical protein
VCVRVWECVCVSWKVEWFVKVASWWFLAPSLFPTYVYASTSMSIFPLFAVQLRWLAYLTPLTGLLDELGGAAHGEVAQPQQLVVVHLLHVPLRQHLLPACVWCGARDGWMDGWI